MKSTAFTLVVLAYICGMVTAPAEQQKISQADNAFAFKLLGELAKQLPPENIFISPYSAATALQMVASGSAGSTKTEMEAVMETSGLSSAQVGSGNLAIATSLNTGISNVALTTANAVWYQQGFVVNSNFIAHVRQAFGATFDPLNFADPASVDVINRWAHDQTHGRIDHIADGMIDANTRLYLANAVYFKAKWADPFKPSATIDQPFYLRTGGQVNAHMMGKSGAFAYQRGPDYEAVRLPYENKNLAMYVFLPDTNSSPEKLLSRFSGDGWQRTVKPGFTSKSGILKLPRFKFDYTIKLNDALMTMGMKAAFSMASADFSGIGHELFISGLLQKAFIEVKEEGTEAAAVTVIAIAGRAMVRPPADFFNMVVDRPFLFLIEDNQTGVILFMGMVFDPVEK